MDFSKLNEKLLDSCKLGEPLSKHTYYRIGGPADALVIPRSHSDLKLIAQFVSQHSVPYFILGAGTNVIVADEGFRGLVIKTTYMNKTLDEIPCPPHELLLKVGASLPNSYLLGKAVQKGWQGLVFLTGIPGSVGGAVFMNAGTHLGETADVLVGVEYFDLSDPSGEMISVNKEQLKYEYRKNHFLPQSALVWSATYRLTYDNSGETKKLFQETLKRRKKTQPLDHPSCGSVFKNPKAFGIRAWEVIEKLGLRGHQIGGAQFSEKHPNFIINNGGAKAKDVIALIKLVKERAQKELGVEMEEEVRYLGF